MNSDPSATHEALFTPLHRWLGREAQPLTIELLDAAVDASLEEKADLDFKLTPPTASALAQSDIAKDIAAMANSGGGMLLFGVRDSASRAGEAPGISPEFTLDTYLRDIRRVALNRISPPVLDVQPLTFNDGDRHALTVLVPTTGDAPHLIFNGDNFKAPYRNGPDTAWMNERMLEAAYRARFAAKQSASRSLHELVDHAIDGRPVAERAWMVAVARPAHPAARGERLDRADATGTFEGAYSLSSQWVRLHVHPLDWLDRLNPRPGMRRWIARFSRSRDTTRWREAQAEVCDDGTVTLVSAMGAARAGADTNFGPHEIGSDRAETFLADFFGMMRAASRTFGVGAYDIHVSLRWEGDQPILLRIPDGHLGGYYLDEEHSIPIRNFVPVEAVVDTRVTEDIYLDQLRETALDVVNQGGAQYLHSILEPTGEDLQQESPT